MSCVFNYASLSVQYCYFLLLHSCCVLGKICSRLCCTDIKNRLVTSFRIWSDVCLFRVIAFLGTFTQLRNAALNFFMSVCIRGQDSSVGIATRYGLDGSGIESRWGQRFSAPVQTGPGAHPDSCTMGTGSFPGVKRPGRGADHPPPSKRRGHERVELYLYSPSGPSWSVIG